MPMVIAMNEAPRGGRSWPMAALCMSFLLVSVIGCGGGDGGMRPTPAPTTTGLPTPVPTGGPTPSPIVLASSIVFAPEAIRLDNPTSPGSSKPAASLVLDVFAYDAASQRIEPSEDNPLTVEVYGPEGAITPRTSVITSGSSLTLSYDGSYFADPITLVAWVNRPDGGGVASASGLVSAGKSLGRTQLLHQNPITCEHGTTTYELPILCREGAAGTCPVEAVEREKLKVMAAVGYDDAGEAVLTPFTIDTGSIGTVVPMDEIGHDAKGPGAAGSVYYDSSGRIFSGYYYLASVSFSLADGTVVRTPPIQVLGVNQSSCAPDSDVCTGDDGPPTLHYLGVGFARTPTFPGDTFRSPVDNAFLQMASGSDGTGMSPGYVLSGSSAKLGIASTTGYELQALSPSTVSAGDWGPAQGCFSFPMRPEPNSFCGNLLLDVGITEMFLNLPPDERPDKTHTTAPCKNKPSLTCVYVPDRTEMEILLGTADDARPLYRFEVEREPSGPAPLYVEWVDVTPGFFNIGRRPLLEFDYLFDARCGNVGFAPRR